MIFNYSLDTANIFYYCYQQLCCLWTEIKLSGDALAYIIKLEPNSVYYVGHALIQIDKQEYFT